jgi:hypothetical protein
VQRHEGLAVAQQQRVRADNCWCSNPSGVSAASLSAGRGCEKGVFNVRVPQLLTAVLVSRTPQAGQLTRWAKQLGLQFDTSPLWWQAHGREWKASLEGCRRDAGSRGWPPGSEGCCLREQARPPHVPLVRQARDGARVCMPVGASESL